MKQKNQIPKSRAETILRNYVKYRVIGLLAQPGKEAGMWQEPIEFSMYHEAEARAFKLQKETGLDYGIAKLEVIGTVLYIEKEA